MAIYCGVDFHARQQTICYCDSAGGEVCLHELSHERDDVRGFYSAFAGEVIVGIEASGYSTWFVELVEGLGHRVLIGDAAEIRRLAKRRQKNDRRDAGLILDLLLRDEFPQVHRPPFESREVLRLLRYRHPAQAGADAHPCKEQPASLGLQRRLRGGVAAVEPGGARAFPSVGDERGDGETAGGVALTRG